MLIIGIMWILPFHNVNFIDHWLRIGWLKVLENHSIMQTCNGFVLSNSMPDSDGILCLRADTNSWKFSVLCKNCETIKAEKVFSLLVIWSGETYVWIQIMNIGFYFHESCSIVLILSPPVLCLPDTTWVVSMYLFIRKRGGNEEVLFWANRLFYFHFISLWLAFYAQCIRLTTCHHMLCTISYDLQVPLQLSLMSLESQFSTAAWLPWPVSDSDLVFPMDRDFFD